MRLRHALGLAAFCLVAGSRWLFDAAWLTVRPSPLSQSLHYAVAGVVALILLLLQQNEARRVESGFLSIAAAGVLLLGVPFVLQQFASTVPHETSVVLYAMAPLFTALGAAIANGDDRAAITPSLVGLAGALLLLPWRLPSTGAEVIGFSLVLGGVSLTAVGGVWTYALICGRSLPRSMAIIALSNAILLGLAGGIQGGRIESLSLGDYAAILIDVPQLLLLLWLAGKVQPERLVSRFFLVPLVTIVEGAVMLHELFDARMAISSLLLLLGAGLLLRSQRESVISLNLR